MTPTQLNSPAKINLYLHITGRRADGYHLLDSLVVFCDIGDTIDIAPAPHFSLTQTGTFATDLPPNTDDNLISKAVKALAHVTGRRPDFALTLHKNLPIAAGIGGGSSNAATVLNYLAGAWGMDDDKILHDIALSLGADVPVCLSHRPHFMQGIGDQITLAPNIPAYPLVLVNPNIPLSTPEVFASRKAVYSKRVFPQTALHDTHNDLQPTACALIPDIQTVLDSLQAQDGCILTRMSGSGATCFALFETTEHAQNAHASLQQTHDTWWVRSGVTTPSAL